MATPDLPTTGLASTAVFLWGLGGSVAIEVVHAYRAINANGGNLPPVYRKVPFIVIRLLMAVLAGGLAVAYGITHPILALNVGAAAPLILQTLAETPPANLGLVPAKNPVAAKPAKAAMPARAKAPAALPPPPPVGDGEA